MSSTDGNGQQRNRKWRWPHVVLLILAFLLFGLLRFPSLFPVPFNRFSDQVAIALAGLGFVVAIFATWDFGRAERAWRQREDNRPPLEDRNKVFNTNDDRNLKP